jgi:hypothetical protein
MRILAIDMKKLAIFSATLLALITLCHAIDPVADYSKNRPSDLKGAFVLFKWSVNVGNGNALLFLTGTSDYHQARHDGMMPFWSPYIKHNQNGYVSSTGVDDGNGISPANDVGIDPDRTYIGRITQLGGKKGIITLQVDQGRKGNPSVAYIHAYTIEGDHLRHTILATYDYDSPKGNPIYNEYLTDAKRTKIDLEKVTIP